VVIDHVGGAVKSIETAIVRWKTRTGDQPATGPVIHARRNARAVSFEKSGSRPIKLLKAAGGPVATPPRPGKAFDEEHNAIVLAQPEFSIEFIDTDKHSERIQPAGARP